MIRIHNTLSRDKQDFVPLEAGRVRIYVCGMTVYDLCHMGHARVMVVFDMVTRWLRAAGYSVTYVRNITDIDDKIIRRAAENGESIRALTDRYVAAMHEDSAALGILRPDHEPRATEHVPSMLAMIGRLIDNGLAYVAGNGDVCYAVRNFAGYGRLSGKSLDELRAGERVDVMEGKQDPLDFVLWKHARAEEPAEVKWDSRWGAGRPGWHIECSAMSQQLLGEHFDIHGGGADLQFPHHENEIAQSEGAHGHAFVNYWMHNGFVRVDGEKMAKSLGNFFTIRDVLKVYDAEVVRYFILHAHYRSPLNYSEAQLEECKAALTTLYNTLHNVPPAEVEIDWNEAHAARFREAMNDDFNSALAISVLFDLSREANKTQDRRSAGLLRRLAGVLGLLEREPAQFLRGRAGAGLSDGDIEARIAERLAAKKARDFARADQLRDELKAAGIILEDRPGGTTEWRRA
ncbi:MAG: cysteine--tRNA ligase [Rhodocyclaceae bacterium]|nr:cysteine--tRNA ligase [Rhodocyclaceae bacterium]